jgi:competence protein ComGC
MRKNSFLYRVYDLYHDGFRSMTLGKTLWAIMLIKIFIIFVVLKLFFFPNFLKQHAQGDEAGYVATELTDRAAPD